MDYTKVPRRLLYKERLSLDRFSKENALNAVIIDNMEDIDELLENNFESIALSCMNTAYYICTEVLLDEKPFRRWPVYRDQAREPSHKLVFQTITLVIVAILLTHYDEEWLQANEKFISKLKEFVRNNYTVGLVFDDAKMHAEFDSNAREIHYARTIAPLLKGIDQGYHLTHDAFAPRDIRARDISEGDIEDNLDYFVDAIKRIPKRQEQLNYIVKIITPFRRRMREKRINSNPSEPGIMFVDTRCEYVYDTLSSLYGELRDQPTTVALPGDSPSGTKPQLDENAVEMERLREAIASLKRELGEKQETIVRQGLELSEYEEKHSGLTAKQAALFGHALAEFCESTECPSFATKRKREDLAPMVSKLFGWGQKSIYNKMTEGYNNNDRKAVADVFADVWPAFANYVTDTFDRRH